MSWCSKSLFFIVFVYQVFNAVCLNYETKFGILSDDVENKATSQTIPEISYGECKNTCSLRSNCWFINYHATAHICYVVNISVCRETNLLKTEKRPKFVTGLKLEFDKDDSMTKYDKCCGPPKSINGTRVLGNMQNAGSKVRYICDDMKEEDDVIECLPNSTWSSTNLTCETGRCHEVSNLESCYRLVSPFRDWNTTKDYCEEIGGYLADITDEEEMDHVIEYLKSLSETAEMFYAQTIYIGLNNMVNSSEFRRMNGKLATFFYWQGDGPYDDVSSSSTKEFDEHNGTHSELATDYLNDTTIVTHNRLSSNGARYTTEIPRVNESETERKRCVTLGVWNDLKWTKTNCDDHHLSLCEHYKEVECESKGCYWIVSKPTTWSKAKKKCQSYNGHLADINDAKEMDIVHDYIRSLQDIAINVDSQIFIGLNNRQNKSEYRWINNEIATYFNWEFHPTSPYHTNPTTTHKDNGNVRDDGNWLNSSYEGGITDMQYTLYNISTTASQADEWSWWLFKQCVAITINKEYKWTMVSCYNLEMGLCEFDTPRDDDYYFFF